MTLRREGSVNIEGEIREMQPQAKEYGLPAEAGRIRNGFSSLEPLKGAWIC